MERENFTMKMERFTCLVACAGLAFAAPAIAQPVAIDTFGPGNAYNAGASHPIRGFSSGSGSFVSNGYLFTAGATGEVTQVITALEHLSGDNNYTIQIHTGDANQVGPPIGQWLNVQGGTAANPIATASGPAIFGPTILNEGQTYWILAIGQGSATGRWFQRQTAVQPSTYWAQSSNGTQWWLVNSTQLRAMRIVLDGPVGCYANCDGSTTVPILNVEDFTCFINEFAAAQTLTPAQQVESYANCDGSTTQPVLNIDDFTCFINQFALGCP
jgi:hypothetical protein